MKIAILQSKWNEDIDVCLQHVVRKVRKILNDSDVDFLLLPEFFLGPAWFQPGQEKLKGITDGTIPGTISDIFSGIAKEYKVNIILGTIIEQVGDKYYNTSTVIGRGGNIIKKVHKMHTFAGEKKNCISSNIIETIKVDNSTIGIAICSDFWMLEFMKILSLKNAEIIFIPGGTLGQNTDLMIQALKTIAYLTSSIIVYASAVGTISGVRGEHEVHMEYTGCSMIITPEQVLKVGKCNDEDILIAEILDDYIKEYRENSLCWKRLVNAKQSLYTEILRDYVDINEE